MSSNDGNWINVGHSPNKRKRKRRKNRNKNNNNNTDDNETKMMPTKAKHAAPANASTIYCKWYQEGICHRGAKCFFIHDVDPLSDKNPMEHKAMIKELLSENNNDAEYSDDNGNIQITLKKPTKPPEHQNKTEFLLPSQNKAFQQTLKQQQDTLNNNNINNDNGQSSQLRANAAPFCNVYQQQQFHQNQMLATNYNGNNNMNGYNYNNFNPQFINNIAPPSQEQIADSTLNVNAAAFEPQFNNLQIYQPIQQQQHQQQQPQQPQQLQQPQQAQFAQQQQQLPHERFYPSAQYNEYSIPYQPYMQFPQQQQQGINLEAKKRREERHKRKMRTYRHFHHNPYVKKETNYNPYLTEENMHTADPFANNNDDDTKSNKINDSLLNKIEDYNSDDYEIWEDENGEIIVVEKDQLYGDDPHYNDKKLLKQFNKERNVKQNDNNHHKQKGIKGGGSMYNYGSNKVNNQKNKENEANNNKNKKKMSPKSNKYAKMASKYNNIYKTNGFVESFVDNDGNSNPDYNPNTKICKFWINGTCAFAVNCKMAHRFEGNQCPHCNKVLGKSPMMHQHHLEKCSSRISFEEEKKTSNNVECGICHENIVTIGHKFGLLTGCNHSFCLCCIREWRGTIRQKKEVVRSCPICRQITYFIVPSTIFVTNNKRKEKIINIYKKRLSLIECRHYKENNGECPFGTSCFYKHINKDGTIDDKKVKLRHILDENGETKIVKQLNLSQFLFDDDDNNE